MVYRMEFDPKGPRVIHALRVNLKAPEVRAVPVLAKQTVYEDDPTKGRGTVSQMVSDEGAIAGINADFFPPSGDPLGFMARDRQVVSEPWKTRGVVGWGTGMVSFGVVRFDGRVVLEDGTSVPIDGVNRECAANELILNTPDAGAAMCKSASVTAAVDMSAGSALPNAGLEGTVDLLTADALSIPIPSGRFMLTATGNRATDVAKLRKGMKVKVLLRAEGFDWSKITHAVGGGPRLLIDRNVAKTWSDEGFNKSFTDSRHPRTAIGVTAKGDLWLVAVDGRQTMSAGATLTEMAELMLRYGCTNALNLDGGGSTTLNLFGLTINRPSDGKERPVANGIVLQGPAPKTVVGGQILISDAVARVVDGQGAVVPNVDVLWSASGDAWIDQSGTLRWLKQGKAVVSARVGAELLSLTVEKLPDLPPIVPPGSPR